MVAPLGTGATIVVEFQLVGVAVFPLNLTVLLPWVDPNVVPEIVTDVPTVPEVGDRLRIYGLTVKLFPLLAVPDTVTTTLPVVAPDGAGATIFVELQLVGVAVVPLNLTVLLPWLDPKFEPLIVTDCPTGPEVGERLDILGAAARTGAASESRTARISAEPQVFGHMVAPSFPLSCERKSHFR